MPKGSESGGGRRKTWVSDGSVIQNGRDLSPRMNTPWWKAPIYKNARLKKWE